jgi:16S rRNA (guanine966-N2)-methyltransferase
MGTLDQRGKTGKRGSEGSSRRSADGRRDATAQRGRSDAKGGATHSPSGKSDPKRAAGEARTLRIIGGMWRGRKLRFPPSPEIRPTPDRVRETVFNWLGPRMPGAKCLDLFAGSGALGLESLSRGAAHVTFVERDGAAARELRARLAEWGASGAEVEHGDALRFLSDTARNRDARGVGVAGDAGVVAGGDGRIEAARGAFDIVFLDPPFASDLLTLAAERLESGGWLAPGALIYVECAARGGLPPLPPTWTTTKAKRAGEVGYHLLTRA